MNGIGKQIMAWILAIFVLTMQTGCTATAAHSVDPAENVLATVTEMEVTETEEATEPTELTEATEAEEVTESTEAAEELPTAPTEDSTGATGDEKTCAHKWKEYHQSDDEGLQYADRICIYCGVWETMQEYVCKHQWTQKKTVEADYIYEWNYCELCEGETEKRQSPNPCAHNWSEHKEASGNKITTYMTCSGCGATVVKTTEENACSHNWAVVPEYKDGVVVNATRSCTVCGAMDDDYYYGDYCNHEWEERKDYHEDGSLMAIVEFCPKCGEWGNVLWIDETNHCNHAWENMQEYYDGVLVFEWRECKKCTAYETILDIRDSVAHEHKWVEAVLWIDDGNYHVRVCEHCTAYEILSPVVCEHEWVTDTMYCGSEIVVQSTWCNLCGEEGEKYVNPDAHQWQEEYVYDETGEVLLYVVLTCQICGEQRNPNW